LKISVARSLGPLFRKPAAVAHPVHDRDFWFGLDGFRWRIFDWLLRFPDNAQMVAETQLVTHSAPQQVQQGVLSAQRVMQVRVALVGAAVAGTALPVCT
jgi:hypothetical protein